MWGIVVRILCKSLLGFCEDSLSQFCGEFRQDSVENPFQDFLGNPCQDSAENSCKDYVGNRC